MEELKGGIQGYLLCLLAKQLVSTVPVWVLTCARIYNVRTLVGTIVRFEVGQVILNILVNIKRAGLSFDK